MKVLMLNGSPHSEGTTFTALGELVRALAAEGIESEIVQIGDKLIRGCKGCGGCKKIGKCVIDDEVNEIAARLDEFDGIVLASPVHYAAPSGTLIAFLDRFFYSASSHMNMKVGAAVVVARRGGCTAAFDVLNKYFAICGMPTAPSQYWNQVHGAVAEDALKDEEGLQTMRTLAKNMSFLMKSIALGKEKYGIPEREKTIRTNFIKR
jgi:multimeric flavodoxin WrbA